MNRREVIRAKAATSLATIDSTGFRHREKIRHREMAPARVGQVVLGDSFFLSKTNPVATADQRELEALALKVMQMPAVTKAKEAAKRRYRALVGKQASEEAWVCFNDEMFAEYRRLGAFERRGTYCLGTRPY